jgi:hypothetical protein
MNTIPNRGPPRMPNIESTICRTVEPKYSHTNAIPIVKIPNKNANNFDIFVAFCSVNP